MRFCTIQKRALGKAISFSAIWLLLFALQGCSGGGAPSGGGGGGNATLKGQVLLVSTGAAPAPSTFAEVNGVQIKASDADGKFTLSGLSATATVLNIRNLDSQNQLRYIRTLNIALTANQTTDLGVIYVSEQGHNANVTGRIVTLVGGAKQPIANASVLLAGSRISSDALGTFTLTSLPVGLGSLPGALLGEVTATGFELKQIFSETLGAPLLAGNNPIGDILIAAPAGSTPLPPFTIRGKVTVNGAAQAGVQVVLKNGATTTGTTATDANGDYFFWVIPAAYKVTASKAGFVDKQANVTLLKLDTPVTAPSLNLTP